VPLALPVFWRGVASWGQDPLAGASCL
jgi:hypothetical protein